MTRENKFKLKMQEFHAQVFFCAWFFNLFDLVLNQLRIRENIICIVNISHVTIL